jgi:predicted sulfurtransferase
VRIEDEHAIAERAQIRSDVSEWSHHFPRNKVNLPSVGLAYTHRPQFWAEGILYKKFWVHIELVDDIFNHEQVGRLLDSKSWRELQ